MEKIRKVPSPFQTNMFAKASLNRRDGVCLAEPYLVEEVAVLGEAAQFALQVDDARLLPHHLNPQLIIPLLQLPDLLPVFILLYQAVGVLGLSLVPRAERLQGGREPPWHQTEPPPAAFVYKVLARGPSGVVPSHPLTQQSGPGCATVAPLKIMMMRVVHLQLPLGWWEDGPECKWGDLTLT